MSAARYVGHFLIYGMVGQSAQPSHYNFYQTKNRKGLSKWTVGDNNPVAEQLTGMTALAGSPSLLTSAHVFSVPLFYLSSPY